MDTALISAIHILLPASAALLEGNTVLRQDGLANNMESFNLFLWVLVTNDSSGASPQMRWSRAVHSIEVATLEETISRR
jgi:hypothetical protein